LKKVKLEIIGISFSQSQSGAYALVLGEEHGKRRLPITIGGFEAQAIAIELEKMKPERPLTHDLFKSFADCFHVKVTEVIINKFLKGVFFAILVCDDGKNEIEIDARTSDAVALALRFQCPIFADEKVLATAGMVMDDHTESTDGANPEEDAEEMEPLNEFSELNLDDLEKLLTEAISDEAFERASQIRDEINKRKKKST
jgi:bifunctional DNase/RNase